MDALTGHALIIISRNDDAMHRGYPVVRAGLTEAQAIAVCNDPRTGGANWFLAHTAQIPHPSVRVRKSAMVSTTPVSRCRPTFSMLPLAAITSAQ